MFFIQLFFPFFAVLFFFGKFYVIIISALASNWHCQLLPGVFFSYLIALSFITPWKKCMERIFNKGFFYFFSFLLCCLVKAPKSSWGLLHISFFPQQCYYKLFFKKIILIQSNSSEIIINFHQKLLIHKMNILFLI